MGQRAVIYARVSTADQSCERQIAELTAFAERGGFEVPDIFTETASGARNNWLACNHILYRDPAQCTEVGYLVSPSAARIVRIIVAVPM